MAHEKNDSTKRPKASKAKPKPKAVPATWIDERSDAIVVLRALAWRDVADPELAQRADDVLMSLLDVAHVDWPKRVNACHEKIAHAEPAKVGRLAVLRTVEWVSRHVEQEAQAEDLHARLLLLVHPREVQLTTNDCAGVLAAWLRRSGPRPKAGTDDKWTTLAKLCARLGFGEVSGLRDEWANRAR